MQTFKAFAVAIILAVLGINASHAQGFKNNSMDKRRSQATYPLGANDFVEIEQGSTAKYLPLGLLPQANGNVFSVAVGSIDAKAATATTLFTVPAGKTFYVTGIKVETTAATAITGGAAITVGSTGTTANSILASTTLANSPVVGGYESFVPKAGALALAAADVVQVTVGTGATGTSQAVRVHLTGYLL